MSYAYLQRSYPSKSKVLISCCKFSNSQVIFDFFAKFDKFGKN
jgi:hypothetical protein